MRLGIVTVKCALYSIKLQLEFDTYTVVKFLQRYNEKSQYGGVKLVTIHSTVNKILK